MSRSSEKHTNLARISFRVTRESIHGRHAHTHTRVDSHSFSPLSQHTGPETAHGHMPPTFALNPCQSLGRTEDRVRICVRIRGQALQRTRMNEGSLYWHGHGR